MVSITYGHGYFTDCDSLTGWTEKGSPTLTVVDTVLYGDLFQFECSPTGVGQYTYFEYDLSPDISSTLYPKFLARYKTDEGAAGCFLKIELVFTSGTQVILDDAYSISLTPFIGTITAAKTIDKIRLYIESEATSGTDKVWVDFLLIHKGTFTLPQAAYGADLDGPPKDAILGTPARDTDIIQNLGTENAVIRFSCDLDHGTWKRSSDSIDGEVFWDIWHNRSGEPWQWINIGGRQFKVSSCHPHERWRNNGDRSTSHLLDVAFKECSLSDKNNELYTERLGI